MQKFYKRLIKRYSKVSKYFEDLVRRLADEEVETDQHYEHLYCGVESLLNFHDYRNIQPTDRSFAAAMTATYYYFKELEKELEHNQKHVQAMMGDDCMSTPFSL